MENEKRGQRFLNKNSESNLARVPSVSMNCAAPYCKKGCHVTCKRTPGCPATAFPKRTTASTPAPRSLKRMSTYGQRMLSSSGTDECDGKHAKENMRGQCQRNSLAIPANIDLAFGRHDSSDEEDNITGLLYPGRPPGVNTYCLRCRGTHCSCASGVSWKASVPHHVGSQANCHVQPCRGLTPKGDVKFRQRLHSTGRSISIGAARARTMLVGHTT